MICTWQFFMFSFLPIQHPSQLFNSSFDSFRMLARLIHVIVFFSLHGWSHVKCSFGKQLSTEYETYVNLSGISGKQKKKNRTQIWEKKEQKCEKDKRFFVLDLFFNWLRFFHANFSAEMTMIKSFYTSRMWNWYRKHFEISYKLHLKSRFGE